MDKLDYNDVLDFCRATDSTPKNIEFRGKTQGATSPKSYKQTKIVNYVECFHKNKIMELLEYSIRSGYEVDCTPLYIGWDGLEYRKVYTSDNSAFVIKNEDYSRLLDEAEDKVKRGC